MHSPRWETSSSCIRCRNDPKKPGGWIVILDGDTDPNAHTTHSVANLPAGDRAAWKAFKVIKGDAKSGVGQLNIPQMANY